MKILLAKDAGYCFGVRDAVNLAYDTADKDGDVYMLGHIVHNENVVKDLDSAGAKVVDSLENIPKDKKSVAINVTIQSINKTLSEKDLDQISKKIIEVVKEKTGATIRS